MPYSSSPLLPKNSQPQHAVGILDQVCFQFKIPRKAVVEAVLTDRQGVDGLPMSPGQFPGHI
jgi:hypothetical protein